MIYKDADDKSNDINILEELLRKNISDKQKKDIEAEIKMIKSGISGEEDAAYLIKVKLGESKNYIVLHDLRLEVKDLSAQIDHLIIDRMLNMWVCESKNFKYGIKVNDRGEFEYYNGYGYKAIPSPIEQNERHIDILNLFFNENKINLPTRMGIKIKPIINSLILVSKNAKIILPKTKFDWMDKIVKADQAVSKILEDNQTDKGILSNLTQVSKIVSEETLLSVARQIKAMHKPKQFDWVAKFGIDVSDKSNNSPPKQKLVCSNCDIKVEYVVAKFCWSNKKFGGKIYCRECQKDVIG